MNKAEIEKAKQAIKDMKGHNLCHCDRCLSVLTRLTEKAYREGLLRARDIVKESESLLLVDIASAIHTEAEASDE